MPASPDRLSATLNALADPTRRAILARLSLGETTVNELAEPFEMSLPAVSKHLKVLEKAGLISRGREKQWRPCKLEPEPLREVDMWLTKYRAMWEARLDRLEAYLHQLQAAAPTPQPSVPPETSAQTGARTGDDQETPS
ncbi:MAG: metalloregulator ArsR/SmtB family transcription factor [Asticcacaulis sp.]